MIIEITRYGFGVKKGTIEDVYMEGVNDEKRSIFARRSLASRLGHSRREQRLKAEKDEQTGKDIDTMMKG